MTGSKMPKTKKASAGKNPAKKSKAAKRTVSGAKSGAVRRKPANGGAPPRKSGRRVTYIVFIGMVALFVALVSFIALYGYFGGKERADMLRSELYFVNRAKNVPELEYRDVKKGGGKKETIQNVLYELIDAGPKSGELSSGIPAGFIQNVVLIDTAGKGLAEVYMSEDYRLLPPSEELFCRFTLVWTLTGLEFIDDVQVFIGGEELKHTNGQPFGLMNRDNMRLDSDFSPIKTEYQTLRLYFSDSQGIGLVLEERTIAADPTQKERSVLQELINGPYDGALVRTLPQDAKFIDIKTEDGACYVDLSKELFAKLGAGGSAGERLAVYSVVNSLCELSNVSRVQFFVDGEKINTGHLDMSAPFEANEDIILD